MTAPREWFDEKRYEPEAGSGLRFSCTMCGNCCSGPEGYVLVDDAECDALARRLGIATAEFIERYTTMMARGRSLTERLTSHGNDCVFLDRDRVPGKAVCGVYEDRPRQCRTWPFWTSVVQSPAAWERAKRVCPGIDQGNIVRPEQIRISRRVIEM